MPFSSDQFLAVFESYNRAIWPLQALLVSLACGLIWLALRPLALSHRIITVGLALLWLWAGVVYHLLFFSRINQAAYLFGALFILQALTLLSVGAAQDGLSFGAQRNIYGWAGALALAYALLIYPGLSYALGHEYPRAPTFGVPCPTTIFTFGLLLWTNKSVPARVLVIPLLWSIIGLSAALYLSMWEDIGLLLIGVTATALILWRDRRWTGKAAPMGTAIRSARTGV